MVTGSNLDRHESQAWRLCAFEGDLAAGRWCCHAYVLQVRREKMEVLLTNGGCMKACCSCDAEDARRRSFHGCLLREKMMVWLSVGDAMAAGMVMVGEEKD
ncbi:hypothetical protein DEO72_LG4g346 [Vigna unguiculata]|uniref:Uncharacterized protein n=1 Tax=Vigna unguiculata TaxID=3917 RepID=A0A4D6LKX0_VIGUN|nr:hypothetical protein DEO72_LG4g346 [Vigna unguiculata]